MISDLDWSYTNPYYFATSSVDTYIFLWDIRDSRRPALSLSAVAGASQVKWNKVNGDVLGMRDLLKKGRRYNRRTDRPTILKRD